ncbi:2,3-bisphosphoglycerate-independent phosphoglycerate mutase [Chitiniphilus shinanonensis]|uniref:2,3-bisphosphoglycerate-independent phosphoglycerate mutase n=1 Tax=Chitiniphilus shinanonensis TaxID=553088 RepID=A0ABQ6BR12_9NEIS|nr:2,3-bisphosphoglycerate-independent phosphoglycerate mutase [Chitiniphilus shinanonensis]GLS04465.1 2,3-bisphosphoglycerate-independent phosphoglycerate mutase [Chitiniphilus shinanonensis]
MTHAATPSQIKPVLLLILDGFGYREETEDNAIAAAHKPNIDRILAQHPWTTINASEHYVGLPDGQFGNSEVGHLNIGAGRVLLQDISRIDVDVAEGRIGENPELKASIELAKSSGKTLHVLGLISDGGVHSHDSHIAALVQDAARAGVQSIHVHAFLDGRDTPPRSAKQYLEKLDAVCRAAGNARIVGIVGRYWAMDRDKRWERVEPAYNLVVDGKGLHHADDVIAGLEAAYARDENDEFVGATSIGAPARMEDGDVAVFMNFRADRARQIATALNDPAFDGFARQRVVKLARFVTATRYAADYPYPVAYDKAKVSNSFGEYIGSLGIKQLRIAETEKYPHVTYFFSGGEEKEFPGEDRILVPSPKVATYDLQPEMSAREVTDKIVAAIESGQYGAIICNYANGDMVGHTGVFDAAVKAIEALDECVGRCVAAMTKAGGEVLITADHGNAELMYDHAVSQPHTQHTTDVVPFVYVGRPAQLAARGEGSLKDIAPTLLAMMGLPQPEEMTGHSLVRFS